MHKLFFSLFMFSLYYCTVVYAEETLVFAAASLKPALDEILATESINSPGSIKTSYAASSALARQIEQGAPASLFISADTEWMDRLEQREFIVSSTRTNLVGNVLVLIAPKTSTVVLKITPGFDLLSALGVDGHLAMAEPNSVPAGKYAKSSLVMLNVWDNVSAHIVAAENVRGALNFVVRGEAPLGIVYRSDAISEPAVRVVDTFSDASHAPIIYPMAIIKDHDTPTARNLLRHLKSNEAKTIFQRYGFDALP